MISDVRVEQAMRYLSETNLPAAEEHRESKDPGFRQQRFCFVLVGFSESQHVES